MARCAICLQSFVRPSLSTGHVFCQSCILRVVHLRPHEPHHECSICRATFSIHTIDPSIIPESSRPFVLPSLRPLYLDLPISHSEGSAHYGLDTDIFIMEITALKTQCESWRRCAESHASTSLKLAEIVRSTREHAYRLKMERDDLFFECARMKEEAKFRESNEDAARDRSTDRLE